jgi:hypothetical protein
MPALPSRLDAPRLLTVDLREHLELWDRVHALGASGGQVFELLRLADRHGVASVVHWLRAGPRTRRLDVLILADLLAAGVTAERYAWLVGQQ